MSSWVNRGAGGQECPSIRFRNAPKADVESEHSHLSRWAKLRSGGTSELRLRSRYRRTFAGAAGRFGEHGSEELGHRDLIVLS